MQVITVPKEVIWVTRLLWIDIIVRLIIVFAVVLTSTLGNEEKLVRLLMVIPKTLIMALIVLGINYFLHKGNKWFFILTIGLAGTVVVSNLFSLFNYDELTNFVEYLIQILLGSLILYLLFRQKLFFK